MRDISPSSAVITGKGEKSCFPTFNIFFLTSRDTVISSPSPFQSDLKGPQCAKKIYEVRGEALFSLTFDSFCWYDTVQRLPPFMFSSQTASEERIGFLSFLPRDALFFPPPQKSHRTSRRVKILFDTQHKKEAGGREAFIYRHTHTLKGKEEEEAPFMNFKGAWEKEYALGYMKEGLEIMHYGII